MRLIVPLLIVLGWLAGTCWFAKARAADPKGPEGAPGLPLSGVVLYTSGVGYFERDGQVEGDTQVELRFKTEDINDLLKSLVVQDFSGGSVSTVTYGSRDPIDKTLKSFGIDLTTNPGLGDSARPGPRRARRAGHARAPHRHGAERRDQEEGGWRRQDGRRRVPEPADRRWAPLDPARPGPARQAARPAARRRAPPGAGGAGGRPRHPEEDRRGPLRGPGEAEGERFLHRRDPGLEDELPARARRQGAAVPPGLGDRREHLGRRLERRQARARLGPPDLVRHGPVRAALRPSPARRARALCLAPPAGLRTGDGGAGQRAGEADGCCGMPRLSGCERRPAQGCGPAPDGRRPSDEPPLP